MIAWKGLPRANTLFYWSFYLTRKKVLGIEMTLAYYKTYQFSVNDKSVMLYSTGPVCIIDDNYENTLAYFAWTSLEKNKCFKH